MIQRVQSIWLLIAALLGAGLFYFDLYDAHIIVNNIDTLVQMRIYSNFGLLLLALLVTLLPLIAIFMFKNRKRQKGFIALSIIAIIAFIAVMMLEITKLGNQVPAPVNGSYHAGAVLPVVAAVFLIMANSGIKKDEKLIRSQDRLR